MYSRRRYVKASARRPYSLAPIPGIPSVLLRSTLMWQIPAYLRCCSSMRGVAVAREPVVE